MKAWCDLLHAVAVSVRAALDLPKHLLLTEEDDDDTTFSVDLLRAFYYDRVDPSASTTLGSSPHTDWGSFTVVYQDHVGGLQTYCRQCDKWMDVDAAAEESPSSSSSILNFIVHVGDITSLVINHAATLHDETDLVHPNRIMDDESRCHEQLLFPSPRHRVLAPVREKRVSLVYFAYPVPELSMSDIIDAMRPWYRRYCGEEPESSICYDDYYVLQNQAVQTTKAKCSQDESKARQQFDSIRNLPIRQVLQDKWQQVQRA